MAIDPNIAMSFKPTTELNLQPTNILAQYGQLAAIQNAQNQNALAQFQLESARRQDVAQNALNKAWQESITPEGKVDYNRLIGTLAAGGAGAQIPSVQKLRTEESKAATEEAARRAKLVVDKTAMYRDMVGNIASRNDAISWLQTQLSDPDMAGSPVTKVPLMQAVARIPTDPAALEQWKTQQALGMTKFTELNKPHFFTENLGATSRISAIPSLMGGRPTVVSETAKTATPGELMQDARARERLAAESESGNYSPATIQYLATQYNLTGQLPTLGIGKKAGAVKMQILEEARKIGTAAPTDGSAAPTPQQAAENVVQNKQTRAVEQSTLRAFSAGPEGRSVRSFNTAVDHLDTMSKLATALENNDIRVFNTVANAFAKGFGVAAPTNFDTAKSIVGGEVAKALAGSSMALKDREEIRDTISRANSPAQLAGSVRTLQELMGGQLKSLKQQYQTGTNRKDFDAKLSPRARQVVSELEGQQPAATGPVKISGDADYDKLPSGAIFIGPDGQQRRKP